MVPGRHQDLPVTAGTMACGAAPDQPAKWCAVKAQAWREERPTLGG
jgi:hypothetical protein